MSESQAATDETMTQRLPADSLPNLLIIWNSIPHRGAGADLLMRRIFQEYPREKLWGLTTSAAVRNFSPRGGVIPDAHLFTAPDLEIHKRILWQLSRVVSWLMLPLVVWRGVLLVRRLKIQAIFAVPWHQFFAAAYLVHRITGVPLYIYIMDDTQGGTSVPYFRSPMYTYFMPRAVHAARRVWCVSEGMCESIHARFGKIGRLLLPTSEVAEFRSHEDRDSDSSGYSLRIFYTGAIYGMQLDALQRLLRILQDGLGPKFLASQISLTLYTSASADYLRKIGLTLGPKTHVDRVEHEEMPRTLAKADILFLPMSFEPRMKHMVSTSIPSKISEYLASGVPILVHGPAYCSAVRYCRESECGLVVDQPDDSALRDALIRLATDAELRQRLSRNAVEAARKNHDAPIVVANFLGEFRESVK